MTKSEIIANIAEKTNLPKRQCERVLDYFVEELTDCLANGDNLTIKGFASFTVSELNPRKARNPKTSEIVTFPSVKVVKCKVSPAIKDAVNGK